MKTHIFGSLLLINQYVIVARPQKSLPDLGIHSGRFRYSPEGLFKGKPGARARFLVNGKPGDPYGLTRLKPGDVILMDAAGGGGYGNPLERDPIMVERDVIEGYVSLEKAKEDYGVLLDPETMKLDEKATQLLRASLKKLSS